MNNPSKKILFLANHFRGPGRIGGARTWHQIKTLSKSFEITLIFPRIDPLTLEKIKYSQLDEIQGVGYKLSFCLKGNRTSIAGRLVYHFSNCLGLLCASIFKKKHDIVIAMGAPFTSAFLGMLISKMKRVPLILDVRDIPIETAEEIGIIKNNNFLQLLKKIQLFIFSKADKIICVSEEMAEFVIDSGVDESKIGINYIGYDNFTDSFPEQFGTREKLLQKLDEKTEIIAFYAGTLATLVDIDTILKAFKKLKNNKELGLVIVGDGEKKQFYTEFSRDNNLNVFFTGRIPKEKVHALTAASDICVYPLKGGPATGAMLGNKLFDYLGAGKPILYSGPDGAVSSFIKKLDAGFILPSQDVDGIVETLKYISNNKQECIQAGLRVQKIILEKYTAESSAKQLSNLVYRVLN